MSKLSDVNYGAIRNLLANANITKALLAIQTAGSAAVKTTNALAYNIDGLQYTKVALATQSIAVTHNAQRNAVGGGYVQPAGTTVYYTLGADKTGAIAVVQGTYSGQKFGTDPTQGVGQAGTLGTSFVGDGAVADVPDGFVAFGLLKVVTGAAAFTPGTTALDAANIAFTFFDVCLLPSVAP